MAVEIDLGAVVPIHKGNWDIGTKYERANIVRYASTAWICKVKESIGVEPTEGSPDWALMVKDISSVTSVNGQKGDVTLDITHSITQPLGTKDTTNATTEFVANTVDPLNDDVIDLKNTIENNTIIKDNTSIIGSANKIPVAGANGKLDNSWFPDTVGVGHPLGYEFASLYVPDGCLICNGGLYSKEVYKDLYDFEVSKNRVITEEEWQNIASTCNGYCALYADNGTQFRVPKVAPYMKIALEQSQNTVYTPAGLPNITGKLSITSDDINAGVDAPGYGSGAIIGNQGRGTYSLGDGTGNVWGGFDLDASRSNPIYGKSSTVTPESTSYLWVVQAFGVATNVGAADVGDALAKFGAIQSNIQTLQATKVDAAGAASAAATTNVAKGIIIPCLAANSWYHMPEDGYLHVGGVTDANYGYLFVQASGVATTPPPFAISQSQGSRWIACTLPVFKGENILIDYTGINSLDIRFCKLQGGK